MAKQVNSTAELAFTVLVAFLLSGVVYMVVAFILGNLNLFSRLAAELLNTFTSAFAGILIGYKLNTLMASHPAPKRSKSSPKKKSKR